MDPISNENTAAALPDPEQTITTSIDAIAHHPGLQAARKVLEDICDPVLEATWRRFDGYEFHRWADDAHRLLRQGLSDAEVRGLIARPGDASTSIAQLSVPDDRLPGAAALAPWRPGRLDHGPAQDAMGTPASWPHRVR